MVLPVLRQAAQRPATMAEIEMIFKPRFETLGVKMDRSPEQWAVWWADYAEALKGLTAAAIEAGMQAYLQLPETEFFPKPGKLKHLAQSTPNGGKWAKAYSRAKAAITPAPVVKEIVPHDRAVVKAEFQELFADLEAKSAAKVDLMRGKARLRPTPSAQVDAAGVSDEMRRLLISQGAKVAPPSSDFEPDFIQDRAA